MAKIKIQPSMFGSVKKALNAPGKTMAKKALNVSAPTGGNKSLKQKADEYQSGIEELRQNINRAGGPKVVVVGKKRILKPEVQQEKLTVIPTMKQISSGQEKEESKPSKTTTPRPGKRMGKQKVVTTFGKTNAPMVGKIPETPKSIIPEPVKEVVKETQIATFPRGSHQDSFKYYASQIADFVKKNPKSEFASLINTSTPETIKESILKLPMDFVPSTNPKEAKKGKQVYSETSQDALVRLLVKAYGEGKPVQK